MMRRALAAAAIAVLLGGTVTACGPFTLSLSVPSTQAPGPEGPQANPGSSPNATAPTGEAAPAQPEPDASTSARCEDGSAPREHRFTEGSPSGRWGGTIREHSGKNYRLEATLRDEGCALTGTFQYVELGCSGTWAAPVVDDVSEPAPGPRGIRARITETVTHDPDQACAATAQVQLVFGPGGMLYASGWDMPDGSEMESRSVLEPLP